MKNAIIQNLESRFKKFFQLLSRTPELNFKQVILIDLQKWDEIISKTISNR